MNREDRLLVIGIGNEFRGDDAVGLYVARKLAELAPPDCDIKESPGEGSQLLNTWQEYRRVIIVDAVKASSAPGAVHRVDALNEKLPDSWVHLSTHTVSLPDAVDLARTLNALPDTFLIFGIEGSDFSPGAGLSDDVIKAADILVGIIADEIKRQRRSGSTAKDSRSPEHQ